MKVDHVCCIDTRKYEEFAERTYHGMNIHCDSREINQHFTTTCKAAMNKITYTHYTYMHIVSVYTTIIINMGE